MLPCPLFLSHGSAHWPFSSQIMGQLCQIYLWYLFRVLAYLPWYCTSLELFARSESILPNKILKFFPSAYFWEVIPYPNVHNIPVQTDTLRVRAHTHMHRHAHFAFLPLVDAARVCRSRPQLHKLSLRSNSFLRERIPPVGSAGRWLHGLVTGRERWWAVAAWELASSHSGRAIPVSLSRSCRSFSRCEHVLWDQRALGGPADGFSC